MYIRSNFYYLVLVILFSSLWQTPTSQAACLRDKDLIIDLETDYTNAACMKHDAADNCIISELRRLHDGNQFETGDDVADLDDCVGIDIFVPGTGNENGNGWHFDGYVENLQEQGGSQRAQFNLKYRQSKKDAKNLTYDRGVKRGSLALKELLSKLKKHWKDTDGNPKSVHVFGYSKGADIVSRVSEDFESSAETMRFFAFGQTGRLKEKIDILGEARDYLHGSYGYVNRVTSNLVTINWANDEAQYFKGSWANGNRLPLIMRIPGWTKYEGGKYGLNFGNSSLDHHKTYGGGGLVYGSGGPGTAFPYCGGGSTVSYRKGSCGKARDTRHPARFWGNQDCVNNAFSIEKGDKIYIGNSEPRALDGSCENDTGNPRLYEVELDLKIANRNYESGNCDIKFRMEFLKTRYDRNNTGYNPANYESEKDKYYVKKGEQTNYRYDEWEFTMWTSRGYRGRSMPSPRTFHLPNQFAIKIRVDFVTQDSPRTGNCSHHKESKVFIEYLDARFKYGDIQPADGPDTIRLIDGLEYGEGSTYNGPIGNKNGSPWIRLKRGPKNDLRMYHEEGLNGNTALVIRDNTNTSAGYYGVFWKPVYLFD
jgi:hypothetical protein